MKSWLQGLAANLGMIGEIFQLFWKHKLWWMVPMILTLVLLGLALVFASVTGVGPFIYSLF